MSTVYQAWTGEKNPQIKTWKKPILPMSIRIKKAEANLARRLKK